MKKHHFVLAWANWLIATGFVIFQFFIQSSAGVMASSWAHDFHLSHVGVGNLSSAFFYPYLLLQVPAGLLFDRYGPKVILSVASLLLGVGCIYFASSHSLGVALLARVVMGAGAGFGFVGMLLVTADWFSQRHFALLVGISESVTMVLLGVGINALTWVVVHWGWRWSMQVAAIVAIIMMLLCASFVRRNHANTHVDVEKKALGIVHQLRLALVSKTVWLSGLYGFFMFATLNAFTALWGFPFLRAVHQLSMHQAAAVMSMVFVGIGIGAPLNGYITMMMGRKKPVMMGYSIMSGLLLLLVIFDTTLPMWLLYVALFFMGFFSSSYIQTFAFASEFVDVSYRGAALSLANMILMSSAPILQLLLGFLLHWHFGYQWAMSVVAFGYLLAAIIVNFLPAESA